MSFSYEFAILGEPSTSEAAAVEYEVGAMLRDFDLTLGKDVRWQVRPGSFSPSERRTAAAAFWGKPGAQLGAAAGLAQIGIPIVPVVSTAQAVRSELPSELQSLNALAYDAAGPARVATALLECAGLLPRQRRVFLSYRREEARAAALQLFDALEARRFDVFLDTHGVPPAEPFQTTLWHRLCESDVLIMLDTATYFDSRWTAAEFGRAQAKGISILRIGWPGINPSPRTATAVHVPLASSDLTKGTRTLARSALVRVIAKLEGLRSESIAVRRLNLVSKLADDVQRIGGFIVAIGIGAGVYVRLPDGKAVVIYPTVGVPTAETLHEASLASPDDDVAVIYDPIGISPSWVRHLDWLGTHIDVPRWLRATHTAWELADWRGRDG